MVLDEVQLEDVVAATKDHGGSFVLAGGLTIDGVTAQCTIESAQQLHPELAENFRRLYKRRVSPKYSRRTCESHMSELCIDASVAVKLVLQGEPFRNKARQLLRDCLLRTVYDATYAALADLQGCEFWTADKVFYDAVKAVLAFVKYLPDYP